MRIGLKHLSLLFFFLGIQFAFATFSWAEEYTIAQSSCPPEKITIQGAFDLADKTLNPAISTAYGSLTRDWEKDLTGASQSKRIVEKLGVHSNVGIVDAGFKKDYKYDERVIASGSARTSVEDGHGTGSLNTMLESNQSSAITAMIQWDELQDPAALRAKLNALQAQGKLPDVVNISYSMGNNEKVRESLNMMANQFNILLVASAGNHGEAQLDQNNAEFPGMIVGSVSPGGMASLYSQRGAAVDIMAPGDYYIGVDYGDGKKQSYGTSFTSPQVAGILGDLRAILPGIKMADAERLVKSTAFKTVNSYEADQSNGAGMINAVLLMEVATKIRQEGWNKDWGLDEQRINNIKASFRGESSSLVLAAAQENSDAKKIEILTRAFALNQSSEAARQALVQMYNAKNLSGMAAFYESMDPNEAARKNRLQTIAMTSADPKQRMAATRTLTLLEPKPKPTLSNAYALNTVKNFTNPDEEDFRRAALVPIYNPYQEVAKELAKNNQAQANANPWLDGLKKQVLTPDVPKDATKEDSGFRSQVAAVALDEAIRREATRNAALPIENQDWGYLNSISDQDIQSWLRSKNQTAEWLALRVLEAKSNQDLKALGTTVAAAEDLLKSDRALSQSVAIDVLSRNGNRQSVTSLGAVSKNFAEPTLQAQATEAQKILLYRLNSNSLHPYFQARAEEKDISKRGNLSARIQQLMVQSPEVLEAELRKAAADPSAFDKNLAQLSLNLLLKS